MDSDTAERGVRGRNIRVLHSSSLNQQDSGSADSLTSGSTTAIGLTQDQRTSLDAQKPDTIDEELKSPRSGSPVASSSGVAM